MTTAKQIVENEIGPQGDLDAFVQGALRSDFILDRLKLDNRGFIYPAVHDTKTGNILAYMRSQYAGDGMVWMVNLGDTMSVLRNIDSRVHLTPMEVDMLTHTHWPTWRAAFAFFLKIPAIQGVYAKILGLSECASGIRALTYASRLEPVIQSLAKRDFFVEKLDRRAGKGTACYVIGDSAEVDPAAVIETLVGAAALNCLIVDNPRVALRKAGTWQIDFNITNLFEDDIGDFVDTAFDAEVPGHAELKRMANLRDKLRELGLPVTQIKCAPVFGGEVNYFVYAGWSTTVYELQNRVIQTIEKALELIGYGEPVDRMNRTIIPQNGSIMVVMKALKPQKLRDMRVESEEADFDEFAEIAAAKYGTIGDELRLKRLCRELKRLGFTIKEATMRQFATRSGAIRKYVAVDYHLLGITHPRLVSDDETSRKQVQSTVSHFLNVDRDLCGGAIQPQSEVEVFGEHTQGYAVLIHAQSLRRHDDLAQGPLEVRQMALEAEDAEAEGYADVAIRGIPGLKTKLWLRELKASLEGKGLTVRDIHAAQWAEMLSVIANVSVPDESANTVILKPKDVINAWYRSVQDTGHTVSIAAHEETTMKSDRRNGQLIYTINSFVSHAEPLTSLPKYRHVSESMFSVDDLNIEEHERLHTIALHAERNAREIIGLDKVEVLGARTSTAPVELNFPPGTVRIDMRFVCDDATSAIAAFSNGFRLSGSKKAQANPPRSVFGTASKKSIPGRLLIDMFVYAGPVGPPMQNPVTYTGPSSSRWPQHTQDTVAETYDADDDVWVRHVIEQTPGYKDLARLKEAARVVEALGYSVVSIRQEAAHGRKETRKSALLDVTIVVNRQPHDEVGTGTGLQDKHKIRRALEDRWELFGLELDLITTEFRSWSWRWLSYDAPQDITSLHIRKGSWDEYLASGALCHEMSTFLVEQFEIGGEEERNDPYFQLFADTEDTVDPLWRERLRLRAVADEIRAKGYTGWMHLNLLDGSLGSPTLFFQLSHPDSHLLDSYSVRAMLRNLNVKYHLCSEGLMWASAHELNRSFVNDKGEPAVRMSIPYMYLNNDPKQGKLTGPKGTVHVDIKESIEDTTFSTQDMDKLIRKTLRPTKAQVAQKAFRAGILAIRQKYPEALGVATYGQSPAAKATSNFTFSYVILPSQENIAMLKSYVVRLELANFVREAILKAGLKQYHPRRSIYYKWPKTDCELANEEDLGTSLMIEVRFNLKAPYLPSKHIAVDDIRTVNEALEDEIDLDAMIHTTLKQTDPVYDTVGRLQAFVKSLIGRNHDWIQDGTLKIAHAGATRAQVTIHIMPRDGQSKPKKFVTDEVTQLMKAQGFTPELFTCAQPDRTDPIVYFLIPIDAQFAVIRFPSFYIDFHDLKVKLAENLDPEEFMQSADQETKYGLYASLREIASRLATDGWLGKLQARSWRDSGGLHDLEIEMAKENPWHAGRNLGSASDGWSVAEDSIRAALKGFQLQGKPTLSFRAKAITGYRDEYHGFWSWHAGVVVDLKGNANDQEIYYATTQCDIRSGAVKTYQQMRTVQAPPVIDPGHGPDAGYPGPEQPA